MVLVDISAKSDKFGYLYPFLRSYGKLRVTHDLGWWLVGKPMVDFLFALTDFFQFRSYKAKCVQLGCFRKGVELFPLKFNRTNSSPINHSWRQKNKDTRLPDSENRIPRVPSFWHNTEVWRTDRRTDRCICPSIYIALVNSFATRCKTVHFDLQMTPVTCNCYLWAQIRQALS